jgi:hypothetical protein
VRIFFDTEFYDTGVIVNLISIGMVREDGAEYYAESDSYDYCGGKWLEENVHPYLTGPKKPRKQIAEEVTAFCGDDPEFWAYYASYDWLCLWFGKMLDVPERWPNFVNDIQSIRYLRGILYQPPQISARHHALNDARWNKEFFEIITREIGR